MSQAPLPPLSQWRANKAQEIYEGVQNMTEATYIADTILAYLQSPSFFMWWFGSFWSILVYKAWKYGISRKR